MLATAQQRPPGTDPAWAIELKWDGIRAIAQTSAAGARIWSRNLNDITRSFPELADALPRRALTLDGEIVAPVPPTGAPSFGRLQRRLGTRPSRELLAEVPTQYFVFDVLAIDGEDVRGHPYVVRRELLDSLGLDVPPIRVPPSWLGADADEMLQLAAETGVEGIVLKRADSAYRSGRSRAWLKVPIRRATEAVVVGWLPGSGAHAGSIGSLVVAAHDAEGRLRFIGAVGTGFTLAGRRAFRDALEGLVRQGHPLDVEPPRAIVGAVRWVEPTIVVDVHYRELTADFVLRQASFRGVRIDKTVRDVGWPA